MKLSVFYCISFTFLVCLIFYIAYTLSGYLIGESSKAYYEAENNFVTSENHGNGEPEKGTFKAETENGEKIIKSNNTTAVGTDMEKSLKEAIELQEVKDVSSLNENDKLIRRRRFLIFPDGSSFQVVFCTTYFTIIPIADIFYMGLTASLAWELPKDPYADFEQMKSRKDKGPVIYKNIKGSHKLNDWGNRILVNRFTGETIQPFTKKYYNKQYQQIQRISNGNRRPTKPVMKNNIKLNKAKRPNPVFSKRSADKEDDTKSRKRKKRASIRPADIEAMHKEHEERKYLDAEYMEHDVIDFHRTSRYGLYEKLDKLIVGMMGATEKECILKALCEMGQDTNGKQGTFLEEILRALFTLHRGSNYHADFNHYDEAHTAKYNCNDVYSECSRSIRSLPMR